MKTTKIKQNTRSLLLRQYIIVLISIVVLVFLSITYGASPQVTSLEDQVLLKEGVMLPIIWRDLGAQMVQSGVIDASRFEAIYTKEKPFSEKNKQILYGQNNKKIIMTRENANMLLNMFWAFGLSNKNKILEMGPMMDKKYGGNPGTFASTGGWSLAVGDPMEHYSKHSFISLSSEQQQKVENIAKNIYRPCCGNSTHFPDCNHGMAMLGLLELMAHNNISEKEMFEVALVVNSYWFPSTYMTLATYFEQNGTSWDVVNPRVVLGADFSSGVGYQRVLQEINPVKIQDSGSCSV